MGRNYSAGGVWSTNLVTLPVYRHRIPCRCSSGSHRGVTMSGHNRGHDVGNPYRGCRGTQTPSGGMVCPCRSARCPRTFPTPSPSTAPEQADLNSYPHFTIDIGTYGAHKQMRKVMEVAEDLAECANASLQTNCDVHT